MKSKDFEIKFGEEGGLIKRPSNGLLQVRSTVAKTGSLGDFYSSAVDEIAVNRKSRGLLI